MTRRMMWAVCSHHDHDEDPVTHFVFDALPDAMVVAARLPVLIPHTRTGFVQAMPAYSPGDQSVRVTSTWTAVVDVHYDGTLSPAVVSRHQAALVDDDGPVENWPGRRLPTREENFPHQKVIAVTAEHTRRRRVIPAVEMRANEVAHALREGADPRDLMYGVPGRNRIRAEHEAALLEHRMRRTREDTVTWLEAEQQYLNARTRERQERRLDRFRSAIVGLFTPEGEKVSTWVPLRQGYVPVDQGYLGQVEGELQLRYRHTNSIAAVDVGEGRLLGGGVKIAYWQVPAEVTAEVCEAAKAGTPLALG